jgi:Cys-rich repeat protein
VLRVLLALCLVVTACSSSDAPLPVQPPGPPIARLLLPRAAAPGEPLPLDGSESLSPGGALLHFRFEPGDGSALDDSGAPRVRHSYAAEGIYSVSLEVEDLEGRRARADGRLTVRAAPPRCAADSDCAGFDVCREARCSALWGPSCSPSPDGGPACAGCAHDQDCPAGAVCRAGVCATP